MYCSRCGAKNGKSSLLCGKCGAPLINDGAGIAPGENPAAAAGGSDTDKEAPLCVQHCREQKCIKASLIISITALVIVVAAVAAGLFIWLNGSKAAAPNVAANVSAAVTPPVAVSKSTGKLVGVAFPTDSLQRWRQDGKNIKAALESKGYEVDLEYADNDVNKQVQQVKDLIEEGCDILVIASIDGGSMGPVLDEAKDWEIPVIAYERFLYNTDKCDYYVTFSYYDEGKVQGDYIIGRLGLDIGAKGPFTMECFGGDSGDNNAVIFTRGAMDVLKKYIDSGVLVVKSGQTEWPNDTATKNWDANEAEARMDKLLADYYADGNIDAVLSANDSLAQGIVASLKKAGYGTADKPFPILTGRDCARINVGQIIRGEQSMSVFEDTRNLTDQAVTGVDAILTGKEVPFNDKYNNGVMEVKTFLCQPTCVDKNNWKALLVDSGYYKLSDIPGAY